MSSKDAVHIKLILIVVAIGVWVIILQLFGVVPTKINLGNSALFQIDSTEMNPSNFEKDTPLYSGKDGSSKNEDSRGLEDSFRDSQEQQSSTVIFSLKYDTLTMYVPGVGPTEEYTNSEIVVEKYNHEYKIVWRKNGEEEELFLTKDEISSLSKRPENETQFYFSVKSYVTSGYKTEITYMYDLKYKEYSVWSSN